MRRDYEGWLRAQDYDRGTISNQLSRVARVEEHYGDLDALYEADGLRRLIEQLAYSVEDQRRGRPNPTKIPIAGNIRNNLASYKSSVLWYRRYREGGGRAALPLSGAPANIVSASTATPRPVEADAPRSSTRSVISGSSGPRTLADFGLDGRVAFEALIASSQYRTLAQAVASLALFSHPQTVSQTGGKALFLSIRNQRRVGQIEVHDGRRVLLDDNKSPTDAFLWANGISRRGTDTQFNHVYAASLDAEAYTALPNICMTPAFIAKLTDTSADIRALLRYRSYRLYGWVPAGHEPPAQPEEYEALEWAAPLPPIPDVQATVEAAMSTKPKDRTVIAAREVGWLFGVPREVVGSAVL